MKKAKLLMVNMCSGGNSKRWVEVEKHGVVVINIDTQLWG